GGAGPPHGPPRVRRRRRGRDDVRRDQGVSPRAGLAGAPHARGRGADARPRAGRPRHRHGDDVARGSARGRPLRRRGGAMGGAGERVAAHRIARPCGSSPGRGAAPVIATAARARDLVSLVKPRIMMMALLTAAGALSLAGGAPVASTVYLLAGTALIVGS